MSLSFPTKLCKVNNRISVLRIKDMVYYYKDSDLIYAHKENDKIAFRFIVCQLFISHLAKQTEIKKLFKISRSSIALWIKNYKEEGAKSLYKVSNKGLKTVQINRKRRKKLNKTENIIAETNFTRKNETRKIHL